MWRLPAIVALLVACHNEPGFDPSREGFFDTTSMTRIPLALELSVDGEVTRVGADAFQLHEASGVGCQTSHAFTLSAYDGSAVPPLSVAFIGPERLAVGSTVEIGYGTPPFATGVVPAPSTLRLEEPFRHLHAPEATLTAWAPHALRLELGPGYLCHDQQGYDCEAFSVASLELVDGRIDLTPLCTGSAMSPSGGLCGLGDPSDPDDGYGRCP